MKQKKIDSYRVVIYTPTSFICNVDHEEMIRRSKELAAQVDRHCDGEGKAEVHFTTSYSCSLCGHPWTEENDVFNACCNENVKEAEGVDFDFDAFEAGSLVAEDE